MEAKGTRLVRRSNGVWYVVYTGNNRGRTTGTRSREEAERFLAAFIQDRDRPQQTAVTGLTVHQAIEDYLAEHVRPKIVAVKNTEIAADYFFAHFPPEKRVADVRDEDIDDPVGRRGYIQMRRAGRIVLKRQNPKPAGDGTLRREIGVLAAAFEHAARRRNPDGTPRLLRQDVPHLPRPKSPPPKSRWLTVEEEAQLIAACRVEDPETKDTPVRLSRIYRFLILALETAGRKVALETLSWFQVNFKTGVIDLNPPGRQQTNKRRAVVRMSTRLRAMLERAYEERTGPWVLDDRGSVRTAFDILVARSGLLDVTPHTLRHTWATRAAQAGVAMREIADWLGDNISTVEKNYYHHSPAYLKDAVDWRERERARGEGNG